MKGYIHSYESFGAVDGPGIRFIVFLKGCLLKCLYCHNPDTWHKNAADNFSVTTPEELIKQILKYKNFICNGGVTISGGEPLLQADFCYELIQLCKENNLHTAIDTSGAVPLEKSSKVIDVADMLLLDIKDIDAEDCKILTGIDNSNAFKTLEYCESINKPVWIRHVLVPEYTLKEDKLKRLADYLRKFSCVKRIDLLPYHTLGKYKWEQLGAEYKLEGIEPPSDEEVAKAKLIFKDIV